MPTDPAYRSYISTGHLTHHDDSHDSDTYHDTAILRVLLKPEYKQDEFTAELSFGTQDEAGGFVRLYKQDYQQLLNVLSATGNAKSPRFLETPGFAVKPGNSPPKHIPLIETDSLDYVHLRFESKFVPELGKAGITLILGDPDNPSAELELTPSQRTDLAEYLDQRSITPPTGRPASSILVNFNGDFELIATGRLHSNAFDPRSEF